MEKEKTRVFGTYGKTDEVLYRSVQEALLNGFTRFDTAQLYKNERLLSKYLCFLSSSSDEKKKGLENIHVTTKIMDFCKTEGQMLEAVRTSQHRLHEFLEKRDNSKDYSIENPQEKRKTSYAIDRVLLHRPMPAEAWMGLERAVENNMVREIGVSNHTIKDLENILKIAKIVPCVNQIEVHPFMPQQELDDLVSFCHTHNILVEAHSVFAKGKMFSDPEMFKIIRPLLFKEETENETPEKKNTTVESHVLAWVLQNKGCDSVCLSSTNPTRVKRLSEAFDDVSSLSKDILQKMDTFYLTFPSRVFSIYMRSNNNAEKEKVKEKEKEKENVIAKIKTIKKSFYLPVMPLLKTEADLETVEMKSFIRAMASSLKGDWELYESLQWPDPALLKTKDVTKEMYEIGNACLEAPLPRMFHADLTGKVATSIALEWLDPANVFSTMPSPVHSISFKSDCTARRDFIHGIWKAYRKNILLLRKYKRLADSAWPEFKNREALYERYSNKTCYLKIKKPEVEPSIETISDFVKNPVPMPVAVAPRDELEPFFDFVSTLKHPPEADMTFPRGQMCSDGRLDMCKQVVGKDFIKDLCEAVGKGQGVTHFLLGNNIAFHDSSSISFVFNNNNKSEDEQKEKEKIDGGVQAMADLIKDPTQKIETWYLAGNCIGPAELGVLCSALSQNTTARALWLKRNPVGPQGAVKLNEMLFHNHSIKILDLHNTGLLDEGLENLFSGLAGAKTSLKHLYLDANGIADPCPSFLQFLSCMTLKTLFVSINALQNRGVLAVLDALLDFQKQNPQKKRENRTIKRLSLSSNGLTHECFGELCEKVAQMPNLKVLDLGYYKSTRDMGCVPNNFSGGSVKEFVELGEMFCSHPSLMYLSVHKSSSTVECVEALKAVVAAHMAHRWKEGEPKKNVVCEQFNVSGCTNLLYSTSEEISRARNPRRVEHIASIYRNNM